MQINSYTPVYIFSLSLSSAEEEEHALSQIVGAEFGRATGCFEGQEERSYIVTADVVRVVRPEFEALLGDCGQEYVLFLDNQRQAALYAHGDNYQHGQQTEYLGTFREVSALRVPTLESWTRVGETYFTTRGK